MQYCVTVSVIYMCSTVLLFWRLLTLHTFRKCRTIGSIGPHTPSISPSITVSSFCAYRLGLCDLSQGLATACCDCDTALRFRKGGRMSSLAEAVSALQVPPCCVGFKLIMWTADCKLQKFCGVSTSVFTAT